MQNAFNSLKDIMENAYKDPLIHPSDEILNGIKPPAPVREYIFITFPEVLKFLNEYYNGK